MTAPPASSPPDPALRFYRFRSVDALIGPRAELAKSQIFFADPESLNDPMEGFKDVVWRGDAIAWRNHLRHYLIGLMQTVGLVLVMGPDYDAVKRHDFTFSTSDRLPTDKFRVLFETITADFFADSRIAAYPAQLARRNGIRRAELLFYLSTLHGRALQIVLQAFEKSRAAPSSSASPMLQGLGPEPLDDAYFSTLHAAEQEPAGAEMTAEFFGTVQTLLDQQDVVNSEARERIPPGWAALRFDYPSVYLGRLRNLMHTPWFTACFVDNCRHSAMWGNYADGHRGVCLEFRAVRDGGGKPALPLRRRVGWRGDGQSLEPIVDVMPHPFRPVRYTARYPELDFFSSLGRMTRGDLSFWFTGPAGSRSTAGDLMYAETPEWRNAYWEAHYQSVTTKLEDWAHEGEHRLILDSVLDTFDTPESRTLTYDFDSLSGIVFGMKTSASDKAAIVRLIREKCAAAGRESFDFRQAVHSGRSGKVEMQRLDLF